MTGPRGPSDEVVLWAARRVVDMHVKEDTDTRATGMCAQCRDDGCDLVTWATVLLAAAETKGRSWPHRPRICGGGFPD